MRFARMAPEFEANPKRSLFRIYRDVRFSKDKSPYKTHAAMWVYHRMPGRGVGKEIDGGAGFYLHLEPGASIVAAGLWMPPRHLLAKVRERLDGDARVAEEDAWEHVFGYSIVNDISARDQRRSGQWFFSKGQDSYAPFGPVVVTADEIPDPHDLDLGLKVNGETKQDSNTRHMLFRIPRLIADISSGVTLEPGDVIATGSPSGVGAGMVPPQFLRPGDLVEATIQHIGTLANPVVDVR